MARRYFQSVLVGRYSPEVISAALDYERVDIGNNLMEMYENDPYKYLDAAPRAKEIQRYLKKEARRVLREC